MDFLKFQGGNVVLERDEILLVKEFRDLLEPKRNICKLDKTGEKGLRVIKELTFIYLVHDWKSPYSEYSDSEKEEAGRLDSGLTPEELKDPVFLQACKRYRDLQDTRILKMLRSSYTAIDNLRIFFETLDLMETDPNTGKPIYAARDVISNIQNLGKMIEGLQQLEEMVKKEKEQSKALRGEAIAGMFDE